MKKNVLEFDRSRYDFRADVKETFRAKCGIGEEVVRYISKDKEEPEWMLQKRLQDRKSVV